MMSTYRKLECNICILCHIYILIIKVYDRWKLIDWHHFDVNFSCCGISSIINCYGEIDRRGSFIVQSGIDFKQSISKSKICEREK